MTGLSDEDRSLYAPNVLFPIASEKWKFITARDHHHSVSFPDGTKWVSAQFEYVTDPKPGYNIEVVGYKWKGDKLPLS